MGKVYLTTKEVATYLKLNTSTLEGMRLEGSGPRFYKVGPGKKASVRYSQEDVDAWLEQRHVNSTSELAEHGGKPKEQAELDKHDDRPA